MGTVRASEDRRVRGSGIKRAGVEEGKREGEDAFCASRVCPRVHYVGSSIENAPLFRDPATPFILFSLLQSGSCA